MRLKQTLFWLLAVILTFGVGALGYLWGAKINSYAAKLPQEKLTAAGSTNLSVKTFNTNFVENEVWRGFFENPINCGAPDARVKTLVMPHHLIAGNYLAGIFNSLKNTHPKVVVIIGPNHTQAGEKTILTTDANWQTVFGNLSGNQDLVEQLVASGLVGIDNEIFNNEQSISSLIPFIKNTWPETQVVPLVIKNEKNEEMMAGLANKLREILPSDSLVIASVDFSHYLPKDVANFHDDLAINVLSTNDLNRIRKMEIDSQNSIRVLFNYNKIIGANKFNLINHTNSADILHQDDLAETTSHVMGYYTIADSGAAPEIYLQLFGDMMLERSVEKVAGTDGLDYVFQNLRGQDNRFFYGADLFVANLEGPFAPVRIPTSKSIAFRFNPELAKQLKRYNFAAFSLANNHALDMGVKNYDFTRQILTENDLAYFGHQTKEGSEYIWVAGENNGLPEKVAFIGLNSTDHPLNWDKIEESIKVVKEQAQYVIVYIHWGEEYQRISNSKQRETAHKLIDAGVTAVIGMHPHVVQEMEIYHEHPIFYSLGNFVFDQYFSKDTQEGISVGLQLTGGKAKNIYVFPFYSNRSQNSLMSGERRAEFFEWWNKNIRTSDKDFLDNKL